MTKSNGVPFNEKLRSLRTQKNWTLLDLATKIGLSEAYVSMLETGVRVPSWETQRGLAKAFRIKLEELMEGVK